MKTQKSNSTEKPRLFRAASAWPATWLSIPIALLTACSVVIGLKDRELDPSLDPSRIVASGKDASTDAPADGALEGGPAVAQCSSYCDHVLTACTDKFQVYRSREVCMSTCLTFPGVNGEVDGGPANATSGLPGNTFACRQQLAQGLADVSETDDCRYVGPDGNLKCGSNCDGYCSMILKICPTTYKGFGACLSSCAYMLDNGHYPNSTENTDTFQCRLYHLGSATQLPDQHCPHAGPPATVDHCNPDDGGVAPDAGGISHLCDVMCDGLMEHCRGDLAVYRTPEICKAVCRAFPSSPADESGSSIDCRIYHSGNAVAGPAGHCPHTGPGGDGHCGSNCEGYCTLMDKFCPASFADRPTCLAQCANIPGAARDSGYSLITAVGPTLQCRLLHVSEAAFDAAGQCPAALGGAPCDK